jgi:hypothetical protein
MADGDESKADRDAGTSSDHEDGGHGVVAYPEFIIGRGKRLGRGVCRVHGRRWFGVGVKSEEPGCLLFGGFGDISPQEGK